LEAEIEHAHNEKNKEEQALERMKQALRLLRDEIDEVDEEIFSLQKEKDEKERLKQEILSHKIEEEKKVGEDENESEEESLLEDEEHTPEELKESDKMGYKVLLRDLLEEKIEEIKLVLYNLT